MGKQSKRKKKSPEGGATVAPPAASNSDDEWSMLVPAEEIDAYDVRKIRCPKTPKHFNSTQRRMAGSHPICDTPPPQDEIPGLTVCTVAIATLVTNSIVCSDVDESGRARAKLPVGLVSFEVELLNLESVTVSVECLQLNEFDFWPSDEDMLWLYLSGTEKSITIVRN